MTIRLSLRKRFGKLKANSKGFSSVIGTTFMVLVMMFLSTTVFMWTLSQSTIYNEAVRARNQEEADRLNENVVALGGNYSVLGSDVTVHVVLKNVGSVPVQIVNLWVLDSDNRGYANKSLNLNMNPGNVSNLVGSSGLKVTIPGADPSHNFTSWFVTARGNAIPLEKELGVIVAQLAQGIGSIALDFYTFRYFEYETDKKLKNYATGNSSFSVPWKTYIAFGIVLTNLDPTKQTVTFDKFSQVWLDFPAVPGAGGRYVYYIVNVTSNGTITTPYSQISLAYGETKILVFASKTAGQFVGAADKVYVDHPDTQNKLCALNLLLHGKLGGRDYGQNIPFVSLYCYT